MSDKPSAREKVTVKYEVPPGYNPTYASGAYGGMIPSGEIAVHFYLDRTDIPEAETYEIADGVLVHPAVSRRPKDFGTSQNRIVGPGVILSRQCARSVASWLLKKADEAEQVAKSREGSTAKPREGKP